MSITFSKTNILHFYCVSCDLAKCFWDIVGNSLFTIVFQLLQNSWVIQIKFVFEKSHRN
jgi:hypothetical protein